MRILVIFTGGTIGSEASGEYISLDGQKPYKILRMFCEKYPAEAADIEFDTQAPYTVLSENADGNTYIKLFMAVSRGVDAGYDGIIVTHGSDTLQYGAAVAAYAAGSDSVPVMVVASNYVLEDERANGLTNFRYAVKFIANHCGKGAYAVYANTGSACKVHCALELMPHRMFDDSLYSVDGLCYGEFDGDNWVYSGHKCPGYRRIQQTPCAGADGCIGIMYIDVRPGMVCPDVRPGTKAVILGSYHSGTVSVKYGPFTDMLKKAAGLSVPVYLVGAYEGQDYESCAEYEKLGIRVLYKIPPAAAYIGVWLGAI